MGRKKVMIILKLMVGPGSGCLGNPLNVFTTLPYGNHQYPVLKFILRAPNVWLLVCFHSSDIITKPKAVVFYDL